MEQLVKQNLKMKLEGKFSIHKLEVKQEIKLKEQHITEIITVHLDLLALLMGQQVTVHHPVTHLVQTMEGQELNPQDLIMDHQGLVLDQ